MKKIKKELIAIKKKIKVFEKSLRALNQQKLQIENMIRKKQMEEDK